MNEVQFVKRKIFLKGQAISLIKSEVWELRTYLFRLRMRALVKGILMWCFNHEVLNTKTTQRIFNYFKLIAD